MEIRRSKKKISLEETVPEETVKVAVMPEPVFEPVKTQQIIEKLVPKVIETPDLGQVVSGIPFYVLALTEKKGFKFKSRVLAKGTHDECVEAQKIYMKKFGVSRNERLYIQKV